MAGWIVRDRGHAGVVKKRTGHFIQRDPKAQPKKGLGGTMRA